MQDYENKSLSFPLSTYCTLTSSACHGFFPQNLNIRFWNKLVNGIYNGRNLEIALSDVYFTPSIDTKKNTIFGHHEKDNIIQVTTRYRSEHYIKKIAGSIEKFVEKINNEFKARGVRVHFNYLVKEDGSQYYVVTLSQANYKLKMTPDYALAMGFTESSYNSGRNVAERPFSQQLFEQIPITTQMDFTIYKDDLDTVIVTEPEIKSVADFISSINTSLQKFTVFFTWDGRYFT